LGWAWWLRRLYRCDLWGAVGTAPCTGPRRPLFREKDNTLDAHAVTLLGYVQDIAWDLSGTKEALQGIDNRQGRKTYGHTAVRHPFRMTQFYMCELSNPPNDYREVLILDIHGHAVLIEGNLGIDGQWLGRFRQHRGSIPRRCQR
jgi:hypothetical protein